MFTLQRLCCLTMSWASVFDVRRNVPIGGGTVDTISAINVSLITPGPLGISETKPRAAAPALMANLASSGELMQHILILYMVYPSLGSL